MTGKASTISFLAIFAVGAAGVWLVLHNPHRSAPRLVAGASLALVAVAGFLVAFRRDLRRTRDAKRAERARVRAGGRRGFVLRQVVISAVILFLPPVAGLCEAYVTGGDWGFAARHLRTSAWIAAVAIPLAALWSVAWWHKQEKRHGGRGAASRRQASDPRHE